MKTLRFFPLVISIIYSLSFNLWVSCADSFYWYSRCDFYNTDFVYVLSHWMSYLWKHLTCNNIQLFWAGGCLLSITSMLIPYFLCQKREDWARNINYLAFGIALFGKYHYQILNPDSYSVFFAVLIYVLFQKTKFESKLSISCLGLLSTLFTASRFPNVLIVFAIVLYFIVTGLAQKCYKQFMGKSMTFLLSFFVCYYFVVLLITKEWDVFSLAYKEIKDSMYYNGASHNLLFLLKSYKLTAYFGMVGIASLLGCTSILNFVNDKLTHARYPICFILSAVFIIVGFHYYTNANWFIVYSAIIVVLILFKAIQRGTVDSYIHFSLVILLGLLVCAGSDSGFTKTYYYFSAIAPLIFISYKEEFANIFACRFMAVVILCISVHALAYEIRLYRCWTNIGKVQVLMKNEDAQRRSQVYRDYKEYGSEGYALFYGWPDAHFMYAATGESLKYRPTFWMGLSNHTLPEHDKREIQEILALLISNDSFKLFDYSHSLQLKELAKEYGLIGQEVSPVTTVYSFKWKRK